MSGWISSKLKVAETLLQQIDQQAAESLRQNETSRIDDDLGRAIPKKPNEILPPLKYQLKKKIKPPENSDLVGKLHSNRNTRAEGNEVGNPKSSLTDSDWTELLSAPSKTRYGSNGGAPRVHGLPKDGVQGRSGSNLSALERKRSQSVHNASTSKSNVVLGGKVSGSDSKLSSDELQGVSENLDASATVGEDANESVVVDNGNGATDERIKDENRSEMLSAAVNQDFDVNIGVNNEKSSMLQNNKINGVPKTSSSRRTSYSSESDGKSDSETDSDSTSDSESEREREERRKRRELILAQKAAAKAVEAIKDRENLVAKLEGEKQSLEKIIEERAKQQAQEASELQMTMMETMEAVDLEKQKHNNTRMEALTKLAKLETTNAELARSLATVQWSLEVEVKRVAELQRQFDLKEMSHKELISKKKSHQNGNKLTASKGVELEHEILQADHIFVTDKVGQLQKKAKTLQTSIEITRREMENPTEIEIELKRRLAQLTDHLIQKQSQVEALSSEKGMLMFRIEAISRSLDENKSIQNTSDHLIDVLESGKWELSNSRLRPMFEDRLRRGQEHIGSLVRQLDAIFLTGSTFLRRNPSAKIWSFGYLICLHLWVLYIFKSHTPVSDETTSGAVISLENINNTGV